ncbi:MAG: DUF116 domain-containing protein [Prolixibacteraceae bacterium]|nr:DUF116 domain-containing protein [Prolixibacteraceae bacterium]
MQAHTVHLQQGPHPISSPYHLNPQGTDGGEFQQHLQRFSNQVTEEGFYRFHKVLKMFEARQKMQLGSLQFSLEETVLDLLMMGVLWNNYQGCWGSAHIVWKAPIFTRLFLLRRNFPGIKNRIDAFRGWLGKKWLSAPAREQERITLHKVEQLNLWLKACCEFQGETARLDSWIRFMKSTKTLEVQEFLTEVTWFGQWFKTASKKVLGLYTCNVEPFIQQQHQHYLGREDYFFTGRSETEYHLNLIGAAIMNKNMRGQFLNTEKKLLLLPSCMAKSSKCKASHTPEGIICQHCTADCNISRTARAMLENGVETRIVEHASGFNASLKKWSNQQTTGLIGTACVLNLISGGMEMKKLNIPAQCIFLDYCGCKKHWNSQGIPTNINIEQAKASFYQVQAV